MTQTPHGPPRWPRVAVGLALLAAVAAVLWWGAAGLSASAVRQQLLDSGPWGPVLFVAAFAALQPFGVSAHVFIVAAALVWAPQWAAALSWLGVMLAGCVAFGVARWMGRGWVQARLPARLRQWDDRLAAHGFRTVLVMRLLFFTFGPMQLMLGVSQVRFGAFLLGSAIGLAPVVVVESFVGGNLARWLFS
ncbi:MAG: VTT domain-containing protein [Nannocystaceae bacterium]|nr:VTT domain-containing protein [Nannocystaceae bacterium]